MAVALVRTAANAISAAPATSITVPFTAATAGNLLVLVIAIDKASGGGGAVTGWTKFADQSGTSASHLIYYKIAAGGETTVTATWTTSSTAGAAATVAEFSGIDSTTPVSAVVTPTYSNTAVTTIALDPPAASATAGGMAVAFVAVDTAAAFPWTLSATGWTNQVSVGASGGRGTGALMLYATALTASQNLASQTFTSPDSDQLTGSTFVINAAAGGPTNVSLTDTGTGTDGLTVAVSVALTDTGAGADGFAVSVPVPLGDTSASTDSMAASVRVPVADSGTGADSLAVSGRQPVTDTATGGDAVTVTARIGLTDTGSGTDALAVTVRVPLADAGTGTDSVVVPAQPDYVTHTYVTAAITDNTATAVLAGDGVNTAVLAAEVLATAALAASPPAVATLAVTATSTAVLAGDGTSTAALTDLAALSILQTTT